MVAIVVSTPEPLADACAAELAAAGHEVVRAAPGDDLAGRATDAEVLVVLPVPDQLAVVQAAVAAVLPAQVAAGRGRVVLVVEANGVGEGSFLDGTAAASWGVVGLARQAARDVAASGVTVNVVRMGLIDGAGAPARPEVVAEAPLKRLGNVDDVAAAVGYLASPEASYVTGTVLPVDGGATMGQGA